MLSLRAAVVTLSLIFLLSPGEATGQGWIDLLAGEPVSDAALLADLHTARSHHRLEEQLLHSLAAGGPPISLFLEALESKDDPLLSRFLAGELSFEEFARRIDWPKRWSNYHDYRGLCLLAREKGLRVFGLDGPAPLFHRIAWEGWPSVPSVERERLGLDRVRFDPLYQRLLRLFLPVHPGMGRSWMRRAAQAQEVRDDWMAGRIVRAQRASRGRKDRAIVICGAGHLRFGLGLPEHVASRLPLPHRILLLVPPPERGETDGPPLPHSALAFVNRPLADYLWLPPKSFPAKSAPGAKPGAAGQQ